MVSLHRSVAQLSSIAVKLTRDGQLVNLDYLSNPFLAVHYSYQRLNLESLFIGQLRLCHHRSFDPVGLRDSDLTATQSLFQLNPVAFKS